jgi:hypothetical protein
VPLFEPVLFVVPDAPVLPVVPEAPMPPLVPELLVLPPELVPPTLPPEVLLPVEPVEPVEPVVVAESSMQSICTGLFECSFALPVSLFASLPAFGWFRLLQVGLLPVVLVLDVEGEVPDVLLDVEGDVAEVLLPCEREVLLVAEPLRDAEEALVELPVAVLPLVLPDVWA